MHALGTQKSKYWVCIHVENLSSYIHGRWDATGHDKNQLAQEHAQILLNLMVEIFGSDGFPTLLWDPSIYLDGN